MRDRLVGSAPEQMDYVGDVTPIITLPERGPVESEIDRMAGFVTMVVDDLEAVAALGGKPITEARLRGSQ